MLVSMKTNIVQARIFLNKASVCKYCRYFMGKESELPCTRRRCREARSLAYRLEREALKASKTEMKPRDAPRYYARVNASADKTYRIGLKPGR